MTIEERRVARFLVKCSFAPGSAEERLCVELTSIILTRPPRLTEEQRAGLWKFARQYRHQLPEDVQSIVEFRHLRRHRTNQRPGN
jgi:hypothetical protein